MLASQYKPHDPLPVEFIRTFRHQHFSGKYFLDRYEALCANKSSTDIRALMPKCGYGGDVADQVALYGFRSLQPTLFFLSPWEFCQWYAPHRLRAPGPKYNWTKFTAAGRQRLNLEKGQKIKWQPGVDFVLNEEVLAPASHCFPYPPWKIFFDKMNLTRHSDRLRF